MAGYIDEAYFSSINPMNAGQKSGLSALAPSFGFSPTPKPVQLNPQANFPDAPGYSSQVTDYNKAIADLQNREVAAYNGYQYNHFGGQTPEEFSSYISHLNDDIRSTPGPFAWASNGAYTTPGQVSAPNLSPAEAPHFDPYYPNESMLALKNYLAPKMAENLKAGLNARGLNYSGVGAYADQAAQGALAQLTPLGMTPQDAFVADLSRNFGYLPAQSIGQAQVPGAHTAPGFTGGDARIVLNPAKQQDPSLQSPLYSIVSGAGTYATPGYFYDPNSTPDVSQMPWLNPGITQPTQPTKPKGNTTFLG